jgi:protein tyrosine kinase modulator
MLSLFPQFSEVLRSIWQGRWVGLAVAWLVAVAGSALIFLTPDKYEATARVYVDTQSILKPLLQGLAVQPNVEQEVAILSRTLISRPNVQKLVRMTEMDVKVRSEVERERLIDELMHMLFIRGSGQGNLYTIGFTDANPAQAARVVQSLLSIFVGSGLSAKSNDASQATRFIEEQIKAYEQRLTEAENRVKEFKLKNMNVNAPAGQDFFGAISTVAESLREAKLLLREAQDSRAALKQQIADEEDRAPSLIAPLGDAAAVATPELDARLASLNKTLDELLLRYTDSHPDVKNARRLMQEVEAQRQDERKRLAEHSRTGQRASSPQSAGNPVYPQLKLAFAEAEAQVAALQARVADLERRHAQLVQMARSVPEREAQFAQLNRDYAIQKQNYDALVARREAALMSRHVEAATGVADFRIIDPPSVSPNPVAPNRKMLVLLALAASLGAGLFASYFFSVAQPTVYDQRTLKRISQRPVLGTVSLILHNSVMRQRRRRLLLFFGGLAGLAATYGAVLTSVFLRGMLPL